ncbi:MAG: hypothetical protein CMG60_02785 [Candidatus Marinimicrobia bacterium]|nr:hypothetical protein [Candidatus Neomarinimicrobiota bacterium]
MTKSSFTKILAIMVLSWFIILSSCSGGFISPLKVKFTKKMVHSEDDGSIINLPPSSKSNPFLNIHMNSGLVYRLSEWKMSDDNLLIYGNGTLFGINRAQISTGDFKIPTEKVSIAESNQLISRLNPLSALTVLSLGLSMACLDGKTCFGSCPTFYVSDGDSLSLMSEGFSISTNPIWESTDIDALFNAEPSGDEIHIRLTNEALETHNIKTLRLLAFPKEKGKRVIRTVYDEFYQSTIILPATCKAEEGDILPEILFFDGQERFSKAGDDNLAEKEYIDISFENIKSGSSALIIGRRQSLLSTFIYYKILDYMGEDRVADMARLIREEKMVSKSRQRLLNTLGAIEVEVLNENGDWISAGSDFEAGPIARDVVGIPLPIQTKGDVKIRLKMTKGLWRIDLIALAELEDKLEPISIEANRVENMKMEMDDDALRLLLNPGEYFTTFGGDQFDLYFTNPDKSRAYEWFLESSGYYLEWHRDVWLKDKNKIKLAEIQAFPKLALKKLAHEYKEIEEEFENLFWSSKYANTAN